MKIKTEHEHEPSTILMQHSKLLKKDNFIISVKMNHYFEIFFRSVSAICLVSLSGTESRIKPSNRSVMFGHS